MKLYHGSVEAGIGRLRPYSTDRQGGHTLFLTDNFAYSLFYIRDREIDFVTCGISADGKVHYDEKFQNQLRILYQGRSGWIYETEVSAAATRVRGIFCCKTGADVLAVHQIDDVYEAIQEEIKSGNVVLHSYAERTAQEREADLEGVRHWLQTDPQSNVKRRVFLHKHFRLRDDGR